MTADDPDLPRGIALAWGVAAAPQRGPKREMSVERIVDAAVDLADAEGLGAVSMAAVASRLGFTPMSLYRYVSAKDDLLLLMQEQAIGLPPETEQGSEDDWRARLSQLYDAQVAMFMAHPWVLSIPIQGSPVTPNGSAWLDAALEALAVTPLMPEERVAVSLLVSGQARFCGMVLAGYADRMREHGQSAESVTAEEAALYDTLISAAEFPALRAAVDAGVFLSDADPFRFGLARCLDGVAAYVAALEEGEPHAVPESWPDAQDPALQGDKKHREAQKAVREAQKALRDARKLERQVRKEALERAARTRGDGS
ncbi:TetR/AcrR family transcriptional regulator C-terminal domain-containing protein [Microbacterium sp. NPDC058342]|uniref:TetR/AcrR family transcriptional regulator C-terminal domain-containing protein n=1 Tax=Microbacterium sp. NPDC058342 TaxID=3346454 RepID=UPI003652A6DB